MWRCLEVKVEVEVGEVGVENNRKTREVKVSSTIGPCNVHSALGGKLLAE